MTEKQMRVRLLDLTPHEMETQMAVWGQPAYRARQVQHWLYKKQVSAPSEMSNLPAALRDRLAEDSQIDLLVPVTETASSDGNTTKALLRLDDGQLIEAVLMRYNRRRTVCVSSQAGCAIGCTFCATGQMGLQRNLSPGEMLGQVIHFERWLQSNTPDSGGITNVVIMGMGEPLANYSNLWRALRAMSSPDGLGLGARRLTVSTVGLVPGIDRFAEEGLQVNLAVSLHAPNDALREQLVPINQRYPIADLMAAIRRYIERTHRRITFEYALMRDINDSPALAEEMALLLQGLLCHVNLIPLNPVTGSPFQPTRREDADIFAGILRDRGIVTSLRVRRGVDINAGCGQLRARVAGSLEKGVL
ncbi:MAG: 23S rRNA (adenine(2503)-C(2))-methyltransferase RlmN [Chloroflexota bacterium]|nr:23S rRNA (adenine(2503)-C(2))-methyltransferase RlmN [Chloroflexota bacterium]